MATRLLLLIAREARQPASEAVPPPPALRIGPKV
jgi:hypothetical protein